MIALIAAYTKNGQVMGKNGKLPWNIPGELDRFKFLTTGNIIIMGRKTFESIGKPLPGRISIVVSNSKVFTGENLFTAKTIKEALKTAESFTGKNIYFAGGYRIFKEALPLCKKLFITEITADYDGDICFPEFKRNNYIEETEKTDGAGRFTYLTYTRRADCRT